MRETKQTQQKLTTTVSPWEHVNKSKVPLLERCFLMVHLPQDNIYPFFFSVIMLQMQQIAYRDLEWGRRCAC